MKKQTQHIDLFEDYENIPANVQKILDKYEEAFMDGAYDGLLKAHKEVNKLGYTFEYYLDGIAYGLRPNDVPLNKLKGYEDEPDEMAKGGSVEDSGLMVIGRTTIDNTRIGDIIEQNDFYAEWNAREGFWFFPEEVENYDELEQQLEELFIEEGINARFEGIFAKGGDVGNGKKKDIISFDYQTRSYKGDEKLLGEIIKKIFNIERRFPPVLTFDKSSMKFVFTEYISEKEIKSEQYKTNLFKKVQDVKSKIEGLYNLSVNYHIIHAEEWNNFENSLEISIGEKKNYDDSSFYATGGSVGNLTMMVWVEFTTTSDSIDLEDKELKNEFLELSSIQKEDDYKYSATALSRNSLWKEFSNQTSKQFKDELQRKLKELVNSKTNNKVVVKSIKIPRGASMQKGGSIDKIKKRDSVYYIRQYTTGKIVGKVIDIDEDGMYAKVRNTIGNIDYVPVNALKKYVKQELSNYPNKTVTSDVIDNVYEWVGLDFSKEQIKEVFDAIEEYTGYEYPKSFKTNGSPANDFEPVHKKVNEVVNSLSIAALEGDDLTKSNIRDIIWGIVMSAHNKMATGGEVGKKRYVADGYLENMNLTELLNKIPIFEQMHIQGYADYTRSKQAYDDFDKKTGNKHLSFEEKNQYDNFLKRKRMYQEKYRQNLIKYLNNRKMATGGEVDEIEPMGRKHKDAVEYGKKLVDKGANHIEVRNKLEEHYPGLKSEMQNVINDILDYKESKMATGGEVLGRNIKFTDYSGETRNGIITESLDGGNFAVSSGFGSILVTPEMVISFDEKPQESKRKLFGFFEEGGNINTEIVTIYVNDYPYYLKKSGDTTHLYMSNSREGIDLVIPSHIGQYNGTPYYTDIRSWLKGGESPNGKKYTETFKDGGKVESKPDKKFLNKISSKVDKVWDVIGAQSGGQIRSDKEMLADYAIKSLIEVEKLGLKKNSLTENDFKHFQNRNDHLLNEFLIWNDFFVNNFAEKEKASFVTLFNDYPNGYADPSIIKVVTNDEMYIPHSKIQSITVLIDGKEVLINGKHILNGANR